MLLPGVCPADVQPVLKETGFFPAGDSVEGIAVSADATWVLASGGEAAWSSSQSVLLRFPHATEEAFRPARDVWPGYPGEHATRVLASSGFLYVMFPGEGIRILDPSTRGMPTEVGVILERRALRDLSVAGGLLLLVAEDGTARLLDVSNPAAPQELSAPVQAPPGRAGWGAATSHGDSLLVASSGGSLLVIRRDGASGLLQRHLRAAVSALIGVHWNGSLLAVNEASGAVQVFRLDEALIASADESVEHLSDPVAMGAESIALGANVLWVATGFPEPFVFALDLQQPEQPRALGSSELPRMPETIVASGGQLFLGTDAGELRRMATDSPLACPPDPLPGCLDGGRARLKIRRTVTFDRSRLLWKARRMSPALPSALEGLGSNGKGVRLCIWDDDCGMNLLKVSAPVPAGPRWSGGANGRHRYRGIHRMEAGTGLPAGGIHSLHLSATGSRSAVSVAARGRFLRLPEPAENNRLFFQAPQVVAQLLTDTGVCFSSVFDQPGRNTAASFVASSR